MKWYPSDWRADPKLRMVSFAARGLWADMLSLMHEGNPYGHLTVAGMIPTTKQLASMVGSSQRIVEPLVAELEEANVFSRTDEGTIYSRRMVRDDEKAATDRANGKGGGNPKLSKPDKGGVNPPDKAGDKAQMLDARIKEPVAKATGKKTTMPTGFDLTPERRAYAQQQRISDVEREWSKFIDYCLSNRKLYADWDAAWRNWCRSPYQQPAQNRSGGNGQRSGSPGSGSLAGAMRAVLAAGGEPGIRTGGVSGGQAFDAGTTSADPDPFAELDAAFGSPVRHPGSHALPVIDQEPVEG